MASHRESSTSDTGERTVELELEEVDVTELHFPNQVMLEHVNIIDSEIVELQQVLHQVRSLTASADIFGENVERRQEILTGIDDLISEVEELQQIVDQLRSLIATAGNFEGNGDRRIMDILYESLHPELGIEDICLESPELFEERTDHGRPSDAAVAGEIAEPTAYGRPSVVLNGAYREDLEEQSDLSRLSAPSNVVSGGIVNGHQLRNRDRKDLDTNGVSSKS